MGSSATGRRMNAIRPVVRWLAPMLGRDGSRMSEEQKWPDGIAIVRHGESAGNVARDAAEAAGHPMIDIATRDMDVPLSERGQSQARTLGEWIGRQSEDERPTHTIASPYVRAQSTARL